MSSSDQDDWIEVDEFSVPVLEDAAFNAHLPNGSPQDVQKLLDYLAPIKVFIWNWFDANKERKLGTFKVIIFNFTLRVKHCEALIELILGPRV